MINDTTNFHKDRSIKRMLFQSRALLTILFLGVIAFMLSGCTEGKIGDPAKPTPTVTTAQLPKIKTNSFELPPEWKRDSKFSPGYLYNVPADIPLPDNAKFIKFELSGTDEGGEDVAKKLAQSTLEGAQLSYANDPKLQTISMEKDLAGYHLFVNEYFADMYPGGYFWSIDIFFVKDGRVWDAIIYGDRFEHQVKTVEKFLQTFKVEYE